MDGAERGVEAARLLARLRPELIAPGLTPTELAEVERRHGFAFADDHRAFLAAGLPHGDRWPDWRDSPEDQVRWPVEGVLFDVDHNGFWYPGWGTRPERMPDALALAAQRLAAVPRMLPVYGHRYLPAGPGGGHPVLSMYQTDIIVYGRDLLDYLGRDFGGLGAPTDDDRPLVTVEFWRDLVA
jgi:hypothetical protein